MKIILVLRNPIERAFSHWNMQRKRNRESRQFLEAIKCEHDSPYNTFPHRSKRFAFENRYLSRGLYTEQIMRLQFFFPESQIHILKNEDLRYKPKLVHQDICNFLEISSAQYENINSEVAPLSRYVAKISEAEWEFLHNYYYHEITRLDKYIKFDCVNWLNKPHFVDQSPSL